MRLVHVFLTVLAMAIIGTGCSETNEGEKSQNAEAEQTSKEEKTEETTTVSKRDLPEELQDIPLPTSAGKYAGDKYDEEKVEAELDKIPQDASEKEIQKKLLALLGENYHPYIDFFESFDTAVNAGGNEPGGVKAPKLPEEKKVNIMILVDASGSMAGRVDGGVKMDLAKQAVKDFAGKMPEGANVSLTVYGHQGSNHQKDKAKSCKSIEEVYPLDTYDEGKFNQALGQFQATGWTPLAGAMKKAKQQLEGESKAENIVYVVSDGIETCGGDPVQAAKNLHTSNINAVVNIIGFDIDEGQKALEAAAKAGGGEYSSVDSKVDLEEHFEDEYDRLWDEWEEWGNKNWDKAQNIGDKKWDEVNEIGDKMWDLAQEEGDRIWDAATYLYSEKDLDHAKEVRSAFFKRQKVLRSYAFNTQKELRSEVFSNQRKTQSDVFDKQREEQRKTLDH